jgi:hypothetical protein
MEHLSKSDFQTLSEAASDYSVSIYLPTHEAGSEIQQDPIRLKNLLAEAETRLLDSGLDQQQIKQRLDAAAELLEKHRFWRYQSQGLALFLTAETAQIYRLPLTFESLVVVGRRFHLKPLLPLFFDNRYFYILALSQNRVRFFQATRHQISEISLQGVPLSLAEALRYDDPEKQLQYHSGSGGGQQPVYHGQGASADDDKTALKRFLTKVNDGLYPYLRTEESPLIIASVDYLQPIYQDVNSYPHLMKEGLSGNPDITKPDDLREAAWPLVATLIERSHQEALNQYQAMTGTGKTGDRLSQLLLAAHRGQIDTLFTQPQTHCWGQFDPTSGEMEQHSQAEPQDQDLLNALAVQTFLQGGTVYSLEDDDMPTDAPAAAIYRYGIPATV